MIKVISAISNRIYDTFGPDYDIHLEPVPQDFQTPAFSIVQLPVNIENGIMGREETISQYDIIYYPEHKHHRQELIEMADKLKNAFRDNLEMDESLNTMQTIPVFDRSWKIVDDILHFTFRLDYFSDTFESDAEYMDYLDQNVEVKEHE